MKRVLVALALTMVALLVPWQAGGEMTALAASGYTVTRAATRPTKAAGGQSVTLEAKVRSRAAGAATVEATVLNARNQVVWHQSWKDQTFARNQTRSYSAAWAVPANLPAGRYRLSARALDSTGRVVGKPRTSTLTITQPRGNAPAPPPAPTATPAPTPTPPPPTYPFAITGSATFATNIKAGLEQMKSESPADYAIVANSLTEIREGPQNYAWGGSRSVQISAASAAHSRGYAGSIVLHEAVHVRNWFANDMPVFGCDGEAKSLRAQAAYLRKAGDPGLAAWVESLIGTWC
jgi:hypothetical protein